MKDLNFQVSLNVYANSFFKKKKIIPKLFIDNYDIAMVVFMTPQNGVW